MIGHEEPENLPGSEGLEGEPGTIQLPPACIAAYLTCVRMWLGSSGKLEQRFCFLLSSVSLHDLALWHF